MVLVTLFKVVIRVASALYETLNPPSYSASVRRSSMTPASTEMSPAPNSSQVALSSLTWAWASVQYPLKSGSHRKIVLVTLFISVMSVAMASEDALKPPSYSASVRRSSIMFATTPMSV